MTGIAGHVPPGPQAADDGSAPGELVRVMADRAAGGAGLREVVTALAAQRLLVPLLEVSGDQLEASDTDPCAGQDRAVAAVSVRTDAGTVGLGFTSLAALTRWNPRARPWPTPAPRVAAALLAEGGMALVVDPGSPSGVTLTGVALRRLATGKPWPPAWADPAVQEAVVAELAPVLRSGEVAVRLAQPDPDAPDATSHSAASAGGAGAPGLVVEVAFPAGTATEVAADRAAVVARRLSVNAGLRAVFDGTLLVRSHVRGADATLGNR